MNETEFLRLRLIMNVLEGLERLLQFQGKRDRIWSEKFRGHWESLDALSYVPAVDDALIVEIHAADVETATSAAVEAKREAGIEAAATTSDPLTAGMATDLSGGPPTYLHRAVTTRQ